MKNERKEELKDEMKNRISMALKDPTLQQGFEIICKGNKELEKENAELIGKVAFLENDLNNAKAQIEKMKVCGNCGNEKCTSKYRGNSVYHRQSDGFACADNENWVLREIKEK